MTREERKRRGEIREESGLAIINPYGKIWSGEIFGTIEGARAYLLKEYPEANLKDFSLAMAVRTVEIYRPLGDFIKTPITEVV